MRAINLIPMAGAGQRFLDRGYTQPKPLVPVDGVPMVLRAARCLPAADDWVFVCRAEHLDAGIGGALTAAFPGAALVSVDHLTDGQACTCLLARDRLATEARLTIGACDNAMIYDRECFSRRIAGGADLLIWTFRHNPAVLQDPRMYGWVATEAGGTRARRVSCKIPLSDSPLEDHAVIGTFTFRRARDFLACTDALIAAERRVRGEFYVDEVANVAIERGLRVEVFEVDRYICWGTPQDVDLYHYWSGYFQALAEQAGRDPGGALP